MRAAIRRGLLTGASLLLVCARVNADDPSAMAAFRDLDADASGTVSLSEFLTNTKAEERLRQRALFFQLDADESQSLSPAEFAKKPPNRQPTVRNAFRYHDQDSDGKLSLEEYLTTLAAKDTKVPERNFRVVDFNGDGALTFEEFKAFPGQLPTAERGGVPDPVAELAAEAVRTWRELVKEADANQDGQLSQKEWPQAALQSRLGPVGELKFTTWDADGNDAVNGSEAERLLAIVYGVRHPDGTPLRTPNGVILFWSFIRRADKDGDQVVTEVEFVESHWIAREKRAELFSQYDANHDGKLTYGEMVQTPPLTVDVLNAFLSVDKDLDGVLSPAELLAYTSSGATELRVAQSLGAFDDDHDGTLSLREYRLAPVGNGYVTLGIFDRRDKNNDGALAWDEFYTETSPVLIGLSWELFRRFDRNHDGRLMLDEFEFTVDLSKVPVEVVFHSVFHSKDKDRNGKLEWEEYLATLGTGDAKVAERNFRVVDFNGDGALTFEEFKAFPGQLPTAQRGAIPDPVADLTAEALRTWRELLKEADANQDGQLSQKEWPQAALQSRLGPVGGLKFDVWDADGNGGVDGSEAERLLAIGYGVRHPDGTLLRTPNGLAIYCTYVRRIDKNGDQMLSAEEFIPSHWLGQEKATALFQQLDEDQNEKLAYSELSRSHHTNIDTFAAFLAVDKDLDGFISGAELLLNKSSGATELRVAQSLAAFDDNHDDKLSLREFRLMPIGIGYITLDVFGRKDVDNDGALAWDEFYTETSPVLIGLSWELFRRFDRDHNGRLMLDEFEFTVDLSKVPVEVVFHSVFHSKDKDRNGKLEWEEYLATLGTGDAKVAERNFRVVDFNGDGALAFEEFKAFPGRVPTAQRGAIPDPVADLAAEALRTWRELLKEADANQDGQLSQKEWPQAALQSRLGPVGGLKFDVWDADGNGGVDDSEAERLLAIGYGVRHPDGTLLRTPNGVILYWSFIRRADKDGDQVVTEAEFVESHWIAREKRADLFSQYDPNHDGKLTYGEMVQTPPLTVDVLNAFLSVDKDLDGVLSPAELLPNNSSGANAQKIAQSLLAFDDDHDGTLSLREYRLAPVGNGYVTLGIFDRRDKNNDGALAWDEFYTETSPVLIGLSWELFRRFDRDHNGRLMLDEFEFTVEPTKLSLEVVFHSKDKDRNGKLEWEEYLATLGTGDAKVAERNFRVVDFNGDGALTFEEFKAFPGQLPTAQRGAIPDPVADLAAEALRTWRELLKEADANQDGRLSQKEWPQAALQSRLGPVGELKLAAWDANRDGTVNDSEADGMISMAYGLRHLSGQLLRTPNGCVLYSTYIRRTDKNDDQMLSAEEFIPSHWLGQVKATEMFKQLDEDQNQKLTYAELSRSPSTNIDAFTPFLNFDKDLDGLISGAELLLNKSSGATEPRVALMLGAFDDDHDGKLSLREFRLMPIGNGYITVDVFGRKDADNDGTLAWKEFYTEPSPLLIGLSWELFRRFDRDHNSRLTLDEFEFTVDPTKIPVEVEFQIKDKDRDGRLVFTEVFAELKPDAAKPLDLERYQIRMARAEDKFSHDDRDSNGSLNLEEFSEARQAVVAAAERHRRAVGKLAKAESSSWLLPGFLVADAAVLLGAAWFFFRRRPA